MRATSKLSELAARSFSAGPVGRVLSFWRRSLRTRVVVSIVLLSAVVVGSVGFLVMHQISDGLLKSRVSASVADAGGEISTAEDALASGAGSGLDPGTQIRRLVETQVASGQARGYDVIVLGPFSDRNAPGAQQPPADLSSSNLLGVGATPDVDPASLPAALRTVVERRTGTAWAYTRVRYELGSHHPEIPAVAVGATVAAPSEAGAYAFYYVFPMSDELRTLHLVRRVLLTSGLLLLALVAGVTWLVTRQVITPVRLARRVAERIASGRLEERMQVDGEDDIARLATSFNQMADALQQQIRQLVELSRVQRRFVSDVSHELRTPLTTVRMAGDVLHDARARFDPVTARSAELLQTELDRFESLLADLLEISRFDAGAAALELSDTNLVDLVHRVVDATVPLARSRGVEVVVETAGPVVAEIDTRRVERVVRNLITNAIDHAGGPGAQVDVRLGADAEGAAITVRDHGVGLQPGHQAMVFSRFWRADPARARTSGGTGLGLAIALEDARLHGGWLQVWGAPGQGAQFRLSLPRRAGDPLTHSALPLIPEDARPDLPQDLGTGAR